MHVTPFNRRHWTAAALCLAIATVSGCNRDNDSSDSPGRGHQHDHEPADTAGRLVISQAGTAQVHVYDLDGNQVIAGFDTAYPVSALYQSPDRRYAVVMQRDHDSVGFIDGGIWQEDHADHLHAYEEAPALLSFGLNDRRPTHYEIHGNQAAIFFDGSGDPFVASAISVLTDASIGSSSEYAALPLGIHMHGTAEPRGNFLLTTYREADSADTLPAAVEVYQRQGTGYQFVERFEEPCPDLHGSFSNASHSVFGCSDGVLAVTRSGDDFTAVKIANPETMPEGARVGTLLGHEQLPVFAGIAGVHLFVVDPAGTMTPVDWRGGADVTLVTRAMDADGERLLLLDSSGTLRVLDTASWTSLGSVALIDGFVAGNNPVIAVSHSDHVAFITDPQGRSVHAVYLQTLAVRSLALDFEPAKITWTGIPH